MTVASKRSILCLWIVCLQLVVFAQKDQKKYKEDAEAIRKEIWAWDLSAFKVRDIPAKYANSSSVIIARRFDVTADSKTKVKYIGLGVAGYRVLSQMEVFRQLVKINDKSAVEEYAEFGFTQMQKQSGWMMQDKTSVFLGVKVIKPNGTVKEIDADDMVLTKDEKNEKKAKVAIPNLEPGDIIDYFIAKKTSASQVDNALTPYTFPLYDDSPIMNYTIHFDVGSKYAVEYRCYNGAPDFKLTRGEDDGNVLDVEKQDIPGYTENSLWVSAYRQLPIIRLNLMVGAKGVGSGKVNARAPGRVYKNQSFDEFLEDESNDLAYRKRYEVSKPYPYYNMNSETSKFYKKLAKDKNISEDSLAAAIYYIYRFDKFLTIEPGYDLKKVINYADIPMDGTGHAFYLAMMMKSLDIDNQLILLSSKYAPAIKEIMSTREIAYMVQTTNGKPKIFGIEDVFSPAFFVPSYFENTKQAVTLNTKGIKEYKPKNFDTGETNIPSTTADQNIRIEKLDVTTLVDQNSVHLKRNTTLRGHYKSDAQKQLLLYEDYYDSERKLLGIEETQLQDFESGKKTKTYAAELKAAFAEARSKEKDNYIAEAKDWFEQDVKDLSNYKIISQGVRHTSPDFVYSSEFSIPGLIKKAGNNYILDIGKLQGSPLKVEENQRKRTLDVWGPFARSLKYEMTIQIPDGYTAEGVSSLNKNVENECGRFTCEASIVGNAVLVKLDKVYKNTNEPAANWPKMLAFLDAANEWSNAKLLLKKK